MDRGNEYWIECVNWLVRCEVLRPDHETLQNGACIEDLAYTLRDGVLLCNLVNALDPDCINVQNVNLYPQSTRCLCMQNIDIFLKACHDVFSIKENDLFESPMLFDLSGFYKVLSTLSVLSNTPKALQRTPFGFNIPHYGNSDHFTKMQIREVDTRRSFELSENASLSTHRESVRQDAIYEKLVSVRNRQISDKDTRKKEKRAFIIEEIITNEKSFLHGVLKTVLQSYMVPLKTVLEPYDTKAIFGDMEKLAELHEDFYEDLLHSSLPDSDGLLCNTFLKRNYQFLMYGEYCANLPRAIELLKDLSNSRVDVRNMLNACKAALNGRFNLSDMLVVPMQHVLKYRLLLERLRRETAEDHPEYGALQKACEAMVDVNNYVNDVKRDREALQTIEKIEKRINDLQIPGNKSIKDFGRLHKDDDLRIKFMDHKVGNRYVFVFDQVMLICKTLKDGNYACQEVLNLSSYKIKDMQVSTRWGHHWSLIHRSQNTVYVIYARNEEHKRAWMQAIVLALDNIEPPAAKENGHNFIMCTLEKPTLCHFCNKSLKGLIMQGYICQNCKLIVHKMCLQEISLCYTESLNSKFQKELPPPPYGDVTNWNDYRFLGQYPWFAGILARKDADRILQEQKRGTFMLRVRPQHQNNPSVTGYAISLKTVHGLKHMLVFKRMSQGVLQFYLSEARFFPTVVELVEFYKHWPLQENFEELHEKLIRPYRIDTENDASFYNFTAVEGEDADDELADYLDMDKAEEKVPQHCVVKCASLNGEHSMSPTEFHNRNFSHQSSIDQADNYEHNNETKYENIVGEACNSNSNSLFEVESQEGCSSSTSNLHDYEEHCICTPRKKCVSNGEQLSPTPCSDTSTQTQVAVGQTICEQDIEKFGEYVVAALKLVKSNNSLRELMSEMRKVINNKLDTEH